MTKEETVLIFAGTKKRDCGGIHVRRIISNYLARRRNRVKKGEQKTHGGGRGEVRGGKQNGR